LVYLSPFSRRCAGKKAAKQTNPKSAALASGKDEKESKVALLKLRRRKFNGPVSGYPPPKRVNILARRVGQELINCGRRGG
jgi:hypothetical protein